MKIRPVGAEFFCVDRGLDGRTDMTKSPVAFRSFAKGPNTVVFTVGYYPHISVVWKIRGSNPD
jgi:hypothetical protein